MDEKDKYDLRVLDFIPVYGLLSYVVRTSANPFDENSMKELSQNFLRRNLYSLGLIATNVAEFTGLEFLIK